MDNKILQRAVEFTKQKGISVSELCRRCGLNRSYFHTVKGKFSMETVERIKQQYPDLNITWLSTGEGAMLLPETPKSDTGALNNPKSYDLSNEDEITRLRGEVEYLKGQIIARDEEISFYRRTITEALTSTKKGE